MTSDQLIDWLTKKFEEHNVEKVLPDEETIKTAYRSARRLHRVEELLQEIEHKEEEDTADVPENLREMISEKMKNGSKAYPWDSIVWDMVEENTEDIDT